MATNVVMPQLGESVVEGTIGKWFKQVGDTIEQYESIMEVVTDKVTTEIPSPAAGTLLQITVPEGATVKAGTVLAVIGQPDEQVEPPPGAMAPAEAPKEAAAGQRVAESMPQSATAERKKEPAEATLTTSAVAQEPAEPSVRPRATNVAPATPSGAPPAATAPVPPSQKGPEKKNGGGAQRFTPVVARMISEYNITTDELATIQGTGEGGRISKKDLENYLQTREQKQAVAIPALPPWEQPGSGDLFKPTEESFGKVTPRPRPAPAAPAAPMPPSAPRPAAPPSTPSSQPAPAPTPAMGEQVVPLTQMRRSIAEHMVRSKQTIPHVTTIHEADMTSVMEHMKAHQDEFVKQGVKLTYTPYLVQAAVAALKAVPLVNALFGDPGVILKQAPNIGVAVAIEDGLIVPVIKNADDKSLLGLARAVNDLSTRAREKRLSPDDVQGATFTITNYGVFGSLFGTPVIPFGTSAILGVGAIQKRAVVINDAIAIRPMVYLGLTFDHRLLDGAIGDSFMNRFKQFLENYQAM